jgi:Flp pilus assembly protein TadG
MAGDSKKIQRGQAIVLVALMILVLFGFVGLAIDGGRAYLDRRQLQASADAAALAAAYTYMNTRDYRASELKAATLYASDEELYGSQSCSGLGTVAASCTFGDPWGQLLNINVTDKSIAGVSFAVTVSDSLPVAIMQVLGSGPTITVAAAATAVARRAGTNGAAIQTLSPGTCSGGPMSLTFQGTSKTFVTGDIWSNGSILDQSAAAGGSVNGNVIDVCGAIPALGTPTPWTVSGTQANGYTMPDPNYRMPAIDPTSQPWSTASGSTEPSGTYTLNPNLTGKAGCYFLAGGVYDFKLGFTQNADFVSNELRPPDEPALTATTSSINGTISAIPVSALVATVPGGSTVTVAGQAFTVTSAGAASGLTSIPVNSQSVTGTIAIGSVVTTMARSPHQFWDENGAGCGSTFAVTATGSGGLGAGTYSVELTALRWEANGSSPCSGPATPTCYLRESAPSMCRTVTLGSSGVIKVQVNTPDPGADDFYVYLAQNGSCTGLTRCGNVGNGTISSCPAGQPSPPDGEGLPLANGLPNADPPAGTPPQGDLANENHCVDTTTGSNVACPASWTPGAVVFYIPSGGCLDLEGKGDIYIFSGFQLQRVVLYEPGPEQSSQPNSCGVPPSVAVQKVNGNGFTSLIGIFYMPAADVRINGNSAYQATIAGGVISWTATVTGNGNVAITADPTLRTWPPSVSLTQ